jgi:hypothetical protein
MQNGFDNFDTQVSAEEYYADEAWREESLCVQCRTHEAVEDGFCSSHCEHMYHERAYSAWQASDDPMYQDRYEDYMSQYDDDPSPYDGTYSEE